MIRRRKIAGRYLKASVFCFGLHAASVLLEPFAFQLGRDGITKAGYLAGTIFWLGWLGGILFFWLAWHMMHQSTVYQEQKKKMLPGILAFFRTKGVKRIDSIWIVALLISILGNLWVKVPNTLTLIAMSITLFMFYLHMIVNDRVYRYMISNERKERKREEGED